MKATDSADLLEWRRIVAYGAPGVGAGYMYLLLTLYVMKFSTDVLLIAPAVMGTIFGISRIWDAVSDPLAGYFSDRTLSRLGRRRSWLLASILPIAISFVMVFSPPSSMSGTSLSLWMAVAIILFYSAMTVFIVPHMSLGAELTSNYHERSRLYGLRHIAFTAGSILALISMQIFINAEREGATVVRDRTFELSLFAAVVTAGLIAYAVINLRERPDFQGRATGNPFLVLMHIWRNVHARLLMIVTFIENVGGAAIGDGAEHGAGQRFDDQRLGQNIFDAHPFLVLRVRVEAAVEGILGRDHGEVARGGAVFGHVLARHDAIEIGEHGAALA